MHSKLLSLVTPMLASTIMGTAQSYTEKRVLVISGGGARGAWGAGVAHGLLENEMPEYIAAFTTSTGSLMAPLVLTEDTAQLRLAYTTATQSDIFSKNCFNKNGDVKLLTAAWRVITGKKNLGETYNLRRLIEKNVDINRLERMRALKRSLYVSTVSMTNNALHFKSTDSFPTWTKENWQHMVDWIWASANQPVFMTAVEKDGEIWVDGGVKENVPIREAVIYARKHGISTIDVIVNNLEGVKPGIWPPAGKKDNIIQKLLRTIEIFSDEVRLNDIISGIKEAGAEEEPLLVNLRFMKAPEFSLFKNSLFFEPANLKKAYAIGYASVSSAEAAPAPPATKNVGKTLIKIYQ